VGPRERLKDQDIDGVSGEVIYPGVGLTLVAPDAEYLYACCRAYNDWLAEYHPYPDRIKGVGVPCRGQSNGQCRNRTLRKPPSQCDVARMGG
jgi:ribosomal protein L24E